jgi:hypothetical protein
VIFDVKAILVNAFLTINAEDEHIPLLGP